MLICCGQNITLFLINKIAVYSLLISVNFNNLMDLIQQNNGIEEPLNFEPEHKRTALFCNTNKGERTEFLPLST